MTPLKGTATRNKGMALFPRKIDGRYAMIGRQDNENLHLIYSDDLYTWEGGEAFLQPKYPWEFVQIGNCGSPIELDEGWLLFTHGVGPVRKYAIGAVLLDKNGSVQGTRPFARAIGAARTPPSARATYRTWSTPAAPCVTAIGLFCLTPFPIPSRTSQPSRPEPCCGRWWGETSPLPVRNMLAQIGIPRSTFFAWCGQYLTGGLDAPRITGRYGRRIWNRTH